MSGPQRAFAWALAWVLPWLGAGLLTLPLIAAALRDAVERDLMRGVPGLRATIQLLPADLEAHFLQTQPQPLEPGRGST